MLLAVLESLYLAVVLLPVIKELVIAGITIQPPSFTLTSGDIVILVLIILMWTIFGRDILGKGGAKIFALLIATWVITRFGYPFVTQTLGFK